MTPGPPARISQHPVPCGGGGDGVTYSLFLAVPSVTLASADEGAQTVPTEKATTEKGKPRIRREMLSPYEMSLVQTAFGISAQYTTSEPLREALVKIAEKLTNIDRMIVEEDLD